MDMSVLFETNPDRPVSLVKADKEHMVYITDGLYIDGPFPAKLTNRDMLRVVGKALSIGYSDFRVYTYAEHIQVLEMRDGDIDVNWYIVRTVDKSEWFA